MGAWNFISTYFLEILEKIPTFYGRNMASSPAVGSLSTHKKEQSEIIIEAMETKNIINNVNWKNEASNHMSINVNIPSMGESITSAVISKWLVSNGDFVEKDEPIYELETDKITSEATAEVAGQINIIVGDDEEVEIGALVATIDNTVKGSSENKLEKNVIPPKQVAEEKVDITKTNKADEDSKDKKINHNETRKRISPLRKKYPVDLLRQHSKQLC